jgi:arsenate reductase (thioredoxin)
MNAHRPFRILFLCTGNSARSIFCEYFARKLGQGKFEPYSAGANPRPTVNPYTIRVLREMYKIDASDARSKSWDEYKGVKFDFVITVCDNAKESCPFWPGQPIVAHWSLPDPADFHGSEKEIFNYFWKISQQIYRRVDLLSNLPFGKLDRLTLEAAVKEIGTDLTAKQNLD